MFKLFNRLEFSAMLSKKCMLLIVFLMFNASAMDKKIVITESSYTPAFSARHPKVAKTAGMLLVATGVGIVGYMIEKYAPDYVDSVGVNAALWAGLVGGCYTVASNRPALVDSFLTDPQQSVNMAVGEWDKMILQMQNMGIEKEKNISKLTQDLENLYNAHEQRCPIFSLGECTADGWCACVFTRSINPSYRNRFEERTSQLLLEKIVANNNQQAIHYTSFGCGGSLPELIILTKVLAKKPDAKINIHLIEGNTTSYVSAADFLNVSREVTPDQQMLNFEDKFDEYLDFVKKEDGYSAKNLSDDDLKSQIISNVFILQRKYKQFITFLCSTFPRAQLSLSIHNLTDQYLEYIEKHNLIHADVVTAADIQDEMSYLRRGPVSYARLCSQTLKNKPNSSNMWLAKDFNQDEHPGIGTIALQETAGAIKMRISDKENAEEDVYFSLEKF